MKDVPYNGGTVKGGQFSVRGPKNTNHAPGHKMQNTQKLSGNGTYLQRLASFHLVSNLKFQHCFESLL